MNTIKNINFSIQQQFQLGVLQQGILFTIQLDETRQQDLNTLSYWGMVLHYFIWHKIDTQYFLTTQLKLTHDYTTLSCHCQR